MATIDRRGATLSAADPPIGTNPNPDLAVKAPVRVATTGGNITLSGPQTIDGVALIAGDRVLVKDQTDATTNGLYNVATGPWTRTIDANNNSQLTQGTQVLVTKGTVNAGGVFALTSANPIILGVSALTFALAAPPLSGVTITPPALSSSQGLVVSQNGAGTITTAGFSYNSIAVTDNLASSGNTVDGLSVFLGLAGSAVNGARQALQATLWLTAATSPSNMNRYYVAGVFAAQAISNDGGGTGTEKGSIFGINPIATLSASATHMVECSGGEVDMSAAPGSSVLNKYGWKVTQLSTDKVQGSVNDAALFFGNQSGAVGWGTLIQVGDGINANPLTTSGAIMKLLGAPTIANGIDLSGAGTISGFAFKSPGFSVDGSGVVRPSGVNIGSAAASFGVSLKFADNSSGQVLIAGNNTAIRMWTSTAPLAAHIEGVDQTGTGSFQQLQINGSTLIFQTGGVTVGQFAASGGFSIGTTSDPGAGAIYINNAAFMLRTKTSFTNGAGSSSATLTNAPAAGNPTKWIAIDDNGTTRQIPAW
jgi:hypothetical protein